MQDEIKSVVAQYLETLGLATAQSHKEMKLANIYKTSSELAQSISETLSTAGVSLEVAIAALMQLLVAGAFEFQRITKQHDAFTKMMDDMQKMMTSLEGKKKDETHADSH